MENSLESEREAIARGECPTYSFFKSSLQMRKGSKLAIFVLRPPSPPRGGREA